MVAEIPIGVVKSSGSFLVDEVFVCGVKVFPSLLGVAFGVLDDLVLRLLEREGVEGEGGCSVGDFFSQLAAEVFAGLPRDGVKVF